MEFQRGRSIWVGVTIACMLALFAAISFTAVLGKSATYDEPIHLIGGMTIQDAHDFRINPEDPALFGRWASLPIGKEALKLDTKDAFYEGVLTVLDQRWWFAVSTLYQRGGEYADRLLNKSRRMFVLVGVALGGLIACWAYQVGGRWAALGATTVYCLDPNFLAHSALVKNDVPFSFLFCGFAYCLWRLGRDGKWRWLALTAVVCGVAFGVKFSAVLLAPILIVLLGARAALGTPWQIGRIELEGWNRRCIAVIGCALLCAVTVYLITWAAYDFRFSATANGQPLQTQPLVLKAVRDGQQVRVVNGELPGMSQNEFAALVKDLIDRDELPRAVRIDLWMLAHHVFPESWLFGILFTYSYSLLRSAFLLGQVRSTGWWYYFPLTIFFKTALATIVAMFLIPIVVLTLWIRDRRREIDSDEEESSPWRTSPWTAIVLTAPPLIYLLTVMSANLNLGIRHVLPVFPFLYVALGAAFSSLVHRWRNPALMMGGILAVGLMTETAGAFPNYLAFFNVASGGSRGGLHLLGDSNLDWGQDLPALVAWQHEHPEDRLYLSYFGMANPSEYGLNFVNLPGGYPLQPFSDLGTAPGTVAISATNVQGIYLGDQLTNAYRKALKYEQPYEVLNGTIYLYHWPPRSD